MPNCIKCNAEIVEEARFCDECGTEQPQMAFCDQCGAELESGVRFCDSCGAECVTGTGVASAPIPVKSKQADPVPAKSIQPESKADYQHTTIFDLALMTNKKIDIQGKFMAEAVFRRVSGTTITFRDLELGDTEMEFNLNSRPPQLERGQKATIYFHRDPSEEVNTYSVFLNLDKIEAAPLPPEPDPGRPKTTKDLLDDFKRKVGM